MNIVIDKDKLDRYIDILKPTVNRGYKDIFYLEEEIPFKHLATGEEGTITNLPFVYSGTGYYIVYKINGPDGVDEWISHITHVNVCKNAQYFDWWIDGKKYTIVTHHFCNSLNYTTPSAHFGNEGLIKATLSYNIRQQNPSDAYIRADEYIKLFTNERAIKCGKCGGIILPDANPLERVFANHLSCIELSRITDIIPSNYYYDGRSYSRCGELPDDTNKVYKNITKEMLQDALKNLTIDLDYMMVGCGSAGSNIAYQLSKTNMLNKGVLYDNDIIEYKNLRNTVYNRSSTYSNKAYVLANLILNSGELPNTKVVMKRQCKYVPDNDIFNNKYVFNLVDSLTTRLQVAENTKYRYIIDTRFKGLNCGIYIVDKEDEQQYKYYMEGLKQSIKNYIEDVRVDKANITPDIAYRFRFIRQQWECASKLRKRSDKFYNELPLNQKEALLQMLDENRRTCNSPNIIDIYTIMAGIVVSAIRNIETGKEKPFTHLEISTENGMLQQMVVM